MSVEKLLLSTVRIEVDAGSSSGTGFFIGSNYLITCGHVVAGAESISFFWKGQYQDWDWEIDILYNPYDQVPNEYSWLDIALIKVNCSDISASPPPVRLNIQKPNCGEYIFTFGYSYIEKGGESCLLKYEGDFFSEEHWGDSIFKLRDSQIEDGMSGSPMYLENSDSVCGIIQLSREYGGAKGLSIATAVKYIPLIRKINKFARREEKIWLELPYLEVKDIKKLDNIRTRLHLFFILTFTSLMWLCANTVIKDMFNEDAISPCKFSISLAYSCISRRNIKLIQTMNKKIKYLDTEFVKTFGKKKNIGELILETQEYLLIEMILRRFSSKCLTNQARLLDVLDATSARRNFMKKEKKSFLAKKSVNLNFIQKSFITAQEILAPSVDEKIQKDDFWVIVLESLSLWKNNNIGLNDQQLIDGFREKVQEIINNRVDGITWKEISALKSLVNLIIFEAKENVSVESLLFQEIEKYRGYGDKHRETYHWNPSSCAHVEKLKHRLFTELIDWKKGKIEENKISVSGLTTEEHDLLIYDNYKGSKWKKCKSCHNERKK